MYYYFSVKQNVEDIFIMVVIEERNNKKKVISWNRLKNLTEDIIENELDFNGYGTAKIDKADKRWINVVNDTHREKPVL